MAPRFVLYTTVLPVYRAECVRMLLSMLGDDLELYASASHLDPSVKTGIPRSQYRKTTLIRVANTVYLQLGGWRDALSASTLIADFNPRSATAWLLLLLRKLRRRRTLVWGHLHPRSGAGSRTAALRRLMRRAADGLVVYTPGQAVTAVKELSDQPVWVASNALYSQENLATKVTPTPRNAVLYVGRLETEKRVDVVIDAFELHSRRHPESVLVLVGTGTEHERLVRKAESVRLTDRVLFTGWVDDVAELRQWYASAFCSVSPGFAGLGLTQSLGFGVPQIVADDQPHSPEIELASLPGAVHWFDGSDVEAFADRMDRALAQKDALPDQSLVEAVSREFSVESMAGGLRDALLNQSAWRG